MNGKKILRTLLFVFAITLVVPATPILASEHPVSQAERARTLENRLEEIKAMDTRNMTRSEKRALRVEVRAIKKEMAAISGGVYLSVGAILLIALLLILLL